MTIQKRNIFKLCPVQIEAWHFRNTIEINKVCALQRERQKTGKDANVKMQRRKEIWLDRQKQGGI